MCPLSFVTLLIPNKVNHCTKAQSPLTSETSFQIASELSCQPSVMPHVIFTQQCFYNGTITNPDNVGECSMHWSKWLLDSFSSFKQKKNKAISLKKHICCWYESIMLHDHHLQSLSSSLLTDNGKKFWLTYDILWCQIEVVYRVSHPAAWDMFISSNHSVRKCKSEGYACKQCALREGNDVRQWLHSWCVWLKAMLLSSTWSVLASNSRPGMFSFGISDTWRPEEKTNYRTKDTKFMACRSGINVWRMKDSQVERYSVSIPANIKEKFRITQGTFKCYKKNKTPKSTI